ncbi:carbohydrate esterase family 4 protein [Hypoxylon crocopeplum]|nr:carbohydrate esterase family 4 protein [Hypoxylon crocopeplum]
MTMRNGVFFIIFLPFMVAAGVLTYCVNEAQHNSTQHRPHRKGNVTHSDTAHLTIAQSSDEPNGQSLYNLTRPHFGKVPYGSEGIIRTCVNPGQIALTFDDGPYFWTELIMDELEKFRFRGTFFVTGNNQLLNRRIDDERTTYPELLRRMHRRGHQIGSHTWTHPHLAGINRTERRREMVYNEMALRNAVGLVPTYMRPPYAEWRDAGMRADLDDLGYHIVMYDVDTKDFLHNAGDRIEDSIDVFNAAVAEGGQGSYVVLCHDIREWTAKSLVPAMLKTIVERGYEAVTVGECLNDPPEFWYRDPGSERDRGE